jgi:hypothetical protein
MEVSHPNRFNLNRVKTKEIQAIRVTVAGRPPLLVFILFEMGK